jgi:hypothetical protein
VKPALLVGILAVVAVVFLDVPGSANPTPTADEHPLVQLLPADLPASCKQVDGSYPVDLQTKLLYERSSMYQGIMPHIKDKHAQSFDCSGMKGSIYWFTFGDAASSKRASVFIKSLLWGEDKPTKEHPELILQARATVVVVSFSNAPRDLVKAVEAKLGTD